MECTVSFVSCRCAPCGPRSGHVSVRGGPLKARGGVRPLLTPASRRSAATRRLEASRDASRRPPPDASGRVPGRHLAQVSLVLVFYLCFSVLAWSACCWFALGLSCVCSGLVLPSPSFAAHASPLLISSPLPSCSPLPPLHSSSLLHSRPAHPFHLSTPHLFSTPVLLTPSTSPLLIPSPLPSCSPLPPLLIPCSSSSISHPTGCLVLLHPPLPLLTSHSRRPDCAPTGDALPGGQGRRARPCQRPGPRGRTRGPTGASGDECRSVGGEDLACWSPQARAHRSHPRRADRPARARPRVLPPRTGRRPTVLDRLRCSRRRHMAARRPGERAPLVRAPRPDGRLPVRRGRHRPRPRLLRPDRRAGRAHCRRPRSAAHAHGHADARSHADGSGATWRS